MKRKISINIGVFQKRYGDKEALDVAKSLGADAVDFDLFDPKRWDYRLPTSVYSKSDEEITAYFTEIRRHAEEIGIEIGQTHGRITNYTRDEEWNTAVLGNARRDCLATAALGCSS